MTIAYIDPGAGSVIVQTLIAGAVAAPFLLRGQVARALSALRGRRRARDGDRPED